MQTYFLKCKKDTENVNSKVLKRKNGGKMLLSKCAACVNKKIKTYERARSKRIIK